MDITKMKELVNGLNLDKYYDSFIRGDDSYRYFVEIYAFKIKYKDDEVIYIGNRTIPKSVNNNYADIKYNDADYWLNGNNNTFLSLHRYDNTSNMTALNKLGNQKVLNIIKQEIIDCLRTNFNVMIMPKNFDIFEQIGRQIYEWKQYIKKSIKDYTIDDFIEDFKIILNKIRSNTLYWHKYLILKNRFWFISIVNDDIRERNNIMFDELTVSQRVIVVIMKEWLAMIVNQSHLDPNYSMHIDKVLYKLENIHYKNTELFNSTKTNLFQHKNAIKLLLSTMYAQSTDRQIEDVYKRFMTWRRNYNINIFNKMQ